MSVGDLNLTKHKINNQHLIKWSSSTGYYGRCPVTDIEINKNGEIIYNGGSF
jgi:hypothetical protein